MIDAERAPRPALELEIESARRLMLGPIPKAGLERLRAIGATLTVRHQQVAYALKAAKIDPEVGDYVARAEKEKLGGQIERAEYSYWLSMSVYPYHPGIVFHYAEALYRQNKLSDAEMYLRHAIALGARIDPVRQILQEVAARQRQPYHEVPPCRAAPDFIEPLNSISSPRGEAWLYPDLNTIRRLISIMLGPRDVSVQFMIRLQRSCRTAWDLMASLMESDEFKAGNLDLVYVIGQSQRKLVPVVSQ